MKKILILPSFERSVKNLSSHERASLVRCLEQFNGFLLTGKFPYGLRLKKIDKDKYELRAGLKLRIIMKEETDVFYLVLAGSHDRIKRYLRRVK